MNGAQQRPRREQDLFLDSKVKCSLAIPELEERLGRRPDIVCPAQIAGRSIKLDGARARASAGLPSVSNGQVYGMSQASADPRKTLAIMSKSRAT